MTRCPYWRKSSYSGPESNCVEIRRGAADTDVRDTKNRAAGHLAVPAAAWQAFLDRATR